MNKVAIIAAMHGNEVYGVKLYELFTKRYPRLANSVKLIIGNKAAHNKNVRYIDADMNRQYGATKQSHEQNEITRVDSELNEFKPDYIIDIHTTKRNSGIFFISDTPNTARRRIYDMLDMDVCIMQDSVIKRSFIGTYPNAVSLEYSLRSITKDTTEKFINALSKLVEDDSVKTHNERQYVATKLITKSEYHKYEGLKNHDNKPEGLALMVPADISEMDAEYYGFWCAKA